MKLPFISVIMPVYNDQEKVQGALDSLLALDYPKEKYEIVIVDNNSTDNSYNVIQEFAKNHKRIKLLVEDKIQSSYAARNKGIKAARGKVLAFIDSDEQACAEWLRKGMACMTQSNADLIGGRVVIPKEENEAIYAKYDRLVSFNQKKYVRDGWSGAGNLFVHKKVFADIGLFNSRLISGGDYEFSKRAVSAGYKLVYCKDAITYHPPRKTFQQHKNKALRLGKGKAQQHYLQRKGFSLRWFFHFLLLPAYTFTRLLLEKENNPTDIIPVLIVAAIIGTIYSYSYTKNYILLKLFRAGDTETEQSSPNQKKSE
ncbi:hypothetical protein B5M47_01600 [candidate division CPR3 bacterium 4484_211]|uniref:Glycosyltransferase 2-like domain-containing protein n=1 Tax=candidate division CPR3 bacterium 4484_211 TaxID=1968527 RepID=A0A1W9NYK1_UNCC3|nr:MAG: hypothetical protein B5M47_01600 [candidate division CPR3 bacterium 4484_211]